MKTPSQASTRRRLAHCRWCGTPTATHMGRPPTFCSDGHRARYRRAFAGPSYTGAVQITERCLVVGCRLDGTVQAMPGPVRAPGAWADAAGALAAAIHGHPVTIELAPVEYAADPTTWHAMLPPASGA